MISYTNVPSQFEPTLVLHRSRKKASWQAPAAEPPMFWGNFVSDRYALDIVVMRPIAKKQIIETRTSTRSPCFWRPVSCRSLADAGLYDKDIKASLVRCSMPKLAEFHRAVGQTRRSAPIRGVERTFSPRDFQVLDGGVPCFQA